MLSEASGSADGCVRQEKGQQWRRGGEKAVAV